MIYIQPIQEYVLPKHFLFGDLYELKIFTLVTLFSFLMNWDHVCFKSKKSNACDVKKVKTEPEEFEDEEFKEDKKELAPSPLPWSLNAFLTSLNASSSNSSDSG